MVKVGAWNIRGLNSPLKSKEVSLFISQNKLDLICILETRVKERSFDRFKSKLFANWEMIHNYSHSPNGRIWVAWNPKVMEFEVDLSSAQGIHGRVKLNGSNDTFSISAIYGSNSPLERKSLWEELRNRTRYYGDSPWVVLGDFNVVRFGDEKIGGSVKWRNYYSDLQTLCSDACLDDLRFIGNVFSWNNRQEGDKRIACKLDRVLVNEEWCRTYENSVASFLPSGISDHSPFYVDFGPSFVVKRVPFRFFNFWVQNDSFLEIVRKVWERNVKGSPMFVLVTKLKALKKELKILNRQQYGDISTRVHKVREDLEETQRKLHLNPTNHELIKEEKMKLQEFSKFSLAEESFAKQKSRVQWLKEGDQNTKYFYKCINGRRNLNKIAKINLGDGTCVEDPRSIKETFVNHFSKLFKDPKEVRDLKGIEDIIQPCISEEQAKSMVANVSDEEIKATLFSFGNDKAPGPDGFGAFFFKQAWEIIGDDVIQAIKSFFLGGHLLREVNVTSIALIPKCSNPSTCGDFRPISCCNVIYKCITKILANRIKSSLHSFINPSQAAFVGGRKIGDNILLCQELVHTYSRSSTKGKRCTLKVDLMKAYDTLNWNFLLIVMQALGYPPTLINWIKECITTPRFSLIMNGELVGFFSSTRGLRQGDPISPYLFVIAMEVLSRLLSRMATHPDFKFHWRCSKMNLTHLCFADDLMIFCHGDIHSLNLVKNVLCKFEEWSGLKANPLKSNIFLGGVSTEERKELVDVLNFQEGTLPIKYLGVPLISAKLSYGDCKPLIDRILARISSWRSRFLSYAGRLTLVKSVLFSIQVYWSSLFILPSKVHKEIDALLRAFFWSGVDMKRTKAKVAWEDICVPKNEGGLGLMSTKMWNKAAMLRYVWLIANSSCSSIWVDWVKCYLIRNSSFWEINIPRSCTWAWRHILKLRVIAREKIRHIIGNGESTSLWHDNWHNIGPLFKRFGERIIYDSGLGKRAKVSDIVNGRDWKWPVANSRDLMEVKTSITFNPLSGNDRSLWTPSPSGDFSIKSAWEEIRNRKPKVPWYNLIWFPKHIPRHALILWMAIRDKLPTMDKLERYGLTSNSRCVFCPTGLESMDHLFFSCHFTLKIWRNMLQMCSLGYCPKPWKAFLDHISTRWKGNKLKYRLGKLCLGASIYYIWRERNNRRFGGEWNCGDTITLQIKNITRTRALEFTKIDKSMCNRRLMEQWGIPM